MTPIEYVKTHLEAMANPRTAAAMADYMYGRRYRVMAPNEQTDMPFYGVQKPARAPILRDLVRMVPIDDRAAYELSVLELWALAHREEKYLALGLARHHTAFVEFGSIPLYRRLIVEGAWWDLVDEVAVHLVGRVLRSQRAITTPVVRGWGSETSMWLRRTALIAQIGHREETDEQLLFDMCSALAREKDFFIRKAIGWALREYSKTAPAAVRGFVADNADRLSGLSRREATRLLIE